MKYQEWLNGCGCCPDIQDCPPSTGNPCDCDSILLELSKQHTDDLVLQDEINELDEKKLDASAYTPDEYATEEWVNEQGFLKTVEPLKTINGESLIGEGDIVISGGSGDAYTKAETDALLDEKQNVLNAGDYITIDSANTISTSGLVTVEDNEVDTSFVEVDEIENEDNIIQSFSYGTADVMSFDWYGRSSDQTNGLIIFNEEGETIGEASNQGFRWDVYNNSFILKDIYTENGNVTLDEVDVQSGSCHFKISTHNGWFIKYVNSFNRSGYDDGVKAVFYKSFNGGQSADVIENVIEPYLGKLEMNKFGKNFTCDDPLLYEAAYKRFRIKTSNQRYDTISASTSATTNLARAYDVKTYVESKIASGITSGEVQTMIDNSISGKADSNSVYTKSETYTKTEVDNKVSVKPNVWCGNESEWSQISGSTESGTIYLVY